MNHAELCKRARRWLKGTRRCNPVFSGIASCAEVPDAIGWSSCHEWYGSTVIECKTSVTDFYADKKKRLRWKHPQYGWLYTGRRVSRRWAEENSYEAVEVPVMGDYRFYLCELGVLTETLVTEHAPDHGLLCLEGRAVRVVRPAPKRELVNKDAEIRYLRFAIINRKLDYIGYLQDH